MKLKEFIEKLQELPQDAEIYAFNSDAMCYTHIENVSVKVCNFGSGEKPTIILGDGEIYG
jgi:hypothetical protein